MLIEDYVSVKEVSDLLKRMIKVKSVRGSETEVANLIIDVLDKEGIDSYKVIESSPGRGNLIIDINGAQGEGFNLMIIGHSDVVPAEGEWSIDPFGGIEKDGYVYGRGAIDDKGQVAAMVYFAILLHRPGRDFRGQVRLLIAADEEVQHPDHGVRYLTNNHPEVFKGVDGAIGELGGKVNFIGESRHLVIFGEKGALSLKVKLLGDKGHASAVYKVKNSVEFLASFLHELPNSIYFKSRCVAEMFKNVLGWKSNLILNRILNGLVINSISRKELKFARILHSLTHVTIAKTVLKAGRAENVYPKEAEAILDIRFFPENDKDELIKFIKKFIPKGVRSELEPIAYTPSTYSPLNTSLYKAIEKTILDLGSKPLLFFQTGTSDSAWVRMLGIPVYHFMYTENELDTDRIHGVDERIRKDELLNIIRGYYHLLMNLQ